MNISDYETIFLTRRKLKEKCITRFRQKRQLKNARSNNVKENLEIHRRDPQNCLLPENENSKDIYLTYESDRSEIDKSHVAHYIDNYCTNIGSSLATNFKS